MVILKKKDNNKDGAQIELNTINEQNEQTEMEVEGLIPPEPDNNYPGYDQIENQNAAEYSHPTETPLNEEALLELIKKEEENLAKKNNEKIKSLEEIKKDLNSLNSYFNTANKNIYEESFYADLKKQISK